MQNDLWMKGLVVVILGLFFGTSFSPAIITQLENKNDVSKVFSILNQANEKPQSLDTIQNRNTGTLDITTGLVAYWNFNESSGISAHDSAGSYDGTLNGNPQWVTGKFGGALQFDGDSDFVTTPLNQLGQQTISLWFKVDNIQEGKGTLISTHVKDDNYGNLAIGVSNYDNCGVGVVCIDPGTIDWANPPRLCSGSLYEYNNDNWYHLAFTHDGSGNYKLFIDGILKDTYSGSTLTDIIPYFMGRLQSVPSYYWYKGALDEVRIYNRTLSESDIQELYSKGSGNPLVTDAGGPYSGTTGAPVQLSGSATGGTPPYSYAWDLDNDGQYDDATIPAPYYTWSTPGTKTIGLRVTDNVAATDTDTATVSINARPVANFSADPDAPVVNETILFDASTSYDPDGTITQYNWVFGDGSNSSGVMVNHTFIDNGVFPVNLTVTDNNGAKGSLIRNITIYRDQPDLIILRINGGFGVSAVIKNNGTAAATNVSWSIDISSGWIILSGAHTERTIDELAVGASTTIKAKPRGIGPVTITVQAGDAVKEASAFLLGPLMLRVT